MLSMLENTESVPKEVILFEDDRLEIGSKTKIPYSFQNITPLASYRVVTGQL
jgi:hypothetical protein